MSSGDGRIDKLGFRELRIPFKMAFRHASAERAETETAWVEAIGADGTVGSGESCPRPYVTGETLASAGEFVARHGDSLRRNVRDVDTLKTWMTTHHADIDANPAAWCAVELAVLDLLAKWMCVPVEALLSLPPLVGRFRYTAVLGDASANTFHAMAEQYWLMGFREFKVKLSHDHVRDREKMAVFAQWPEGTFRVRADVNNLWPRAEEAVAALRRIDYPFFAVEEPIGKDRHAELPHIARMLNCAIVLDESFVRREQLSLLEDPPSQWLINVRVSKMGGMIRSLEVVEAARGHGVDLVLGAQVGETSLLTRAALTIARAAGNALVAQEGAFGTWLLERDVCHPPLMFGADGVLDAAVYPMVAGPGFGIDRLAG
jgi:L-Ala-D/L-Glu epimerase / N-acetyl-D-glutamate racemase